MRNLIIAVLIFVAGVSLGWYAQRQGAGPPRETAAPPALAPSSSPREAMSAPAPDGAPPAAIEDDLAALLAADAFEAALERYETLRSGADEAAPERAREQLLSRARVLLDASRYDLAEHLLQLYLLSDYRDAGARMLLADVYAGRGDFAAAIDALYEARGYAWQPETLDDLTRRIRSLVANRARALQATGDHTGLLALYQHLTQLEPGHARYFLDLAAAQLALDDSAAARRSLQLVAQDPDVGAQARARLQQLSQARLPASDADASAAVAAVTGVPLHRRGNHFLVDARLNDGASVRLLIDTGASVTILTPRALAGSGHRDTGRSAVFSTANGRVRAPVYTLDALSVGGWQVSRIDIGVLELEDSPDIDGLLGMNFLRHFQFFIDQNEALLRLSVHDP